MYVPSIHPHRSMIHLTVNGSPIELEEPVSIAELLQRIGVPPNYLAVEINAEVIPRAEHSSHSVAEGDEVEVVTLVGGG